MLPGDRLVCAFVEPMAVGQRFAQWPLHVTIVPWFRLENESAAIAAGLSRALRAVEPFEAVGAGEASFRSRKNLPVRLLQTPTPFTFIEAKVRTYFHKKRAWLVDETTKRHYDFRPHVTAQANAGLGQGQVFRVGRLFIIEQKGDYKEVVAVITLGIQ